VTGFAVLFIFEHWTRFLLNGFVGGALWINGHWFRPDQWFVSVWYVWVSFGGAASGWLVGHLHRAHQSSMTFVFAGSFMLSQLCWCVYLTIAPPPYGFSIADFGLFTLTFVVSILLGGVWRARPAQLSA
jgi:hypothetical protein